MEDSKKNNKKELEDITISHKIHPFSLILKLTDEIPTKKLLELMLMSLDLQTISYRQTTLSMLATEKEVEKIKGMIAIKNSLENWDKIIKAKKGKKVKK